MFSYQSRLQTDELPCTRAGGGAYKGGFVQALGPCICSAGGGAGVAQAKPVAEPGRGGLLGLIIPLLLTPVPSGMLFPLVLPQKVLRGVQHGVHTLQTLKLLVPHSEVFP